MTRNPDGAVAVSLRELGAEVVRGDLDDGSSLERALGGAYGAFSVQNFWETGLSHFESKWTTENHIRDIGLPYTIFRPVWFMENWGGPYMRPPILGGTLAMPLDAETNFQQIAVDDVGAFAALAFTNRDAWLGRELDLAGDERTVAEVAETFAPSA